MPYYIAVLLLLIKLCSSQDSNCDFSQYLQVGQTYYVYNTNYPENYLPGIQCRWIAYCPKGYNCRLDCPEINMPSSTGCSNDRLLVSRTGDPQLSGADVYCGRGSLSAVSTNQTLSVGLIVSRNSPGGKFNCRLIAQAAPTSPNNCRCGYKKSNRIVGGTETQVNEYPMMAGLVDMMISKIKCGGGIINPRHVLTAAQCVAERKPYDFAVVVGDHDVSTGDDTSAAKAYPISGFKLHPSYSSSNFDYDVALVVTTTDIVFSELVGPVCLPFKFTNTDLSGKNLTALGWGTEFFGGPTSNVLMKVDLQVVSQSSCQRTAPQLTSRQICTYTPGYDACQDDSGGPLLYTDPATGLQMHIGIISYGSFCASEEPAINTRVTSVLEWIVSTAPYDYCVK